MKISESKLRKIIAENIKAIIHEWADPDSGEFYPGKYIYYPEDGKIVGDMSYDINDIAGLAEDTPEGVVNGIMEYFEDDYADWEDERDPNAPVVLYVMSADGSAIGNTYYISSLDAEYAGEIQAKLGAGAKVVSVNPANNINESKINKNMKSTVKLNENSLKRIVAESIRRAINENEEEFIGDELQSIKNAVISIKQKIANGNLAGNSYDPSADNFLSSKINEIDEIVTSLLNNDWF